MVDRIQDLTSSEGAHKTISAYYKVLNRFNGVNQLQGYTQGQEKAVNELSKLIDPMVDLGEITAKDLANVLKRILISNAISESHASKPSPWD